MSGDIWRPYIQPLKVQLCLSVIVISTSMRDHTQWFNPREGGMTDSGTAKSGTTTLTALDSQNVCFAIIR